MRLVRSSAAWRLFQGLATLGRSKRHSPPQGDVPPDDAFATIGRVLDQLRDPAVVFVDVGTGNGEALGRLQDGVTQRKPVISIGVDPVQTRGFPWYTGYVLGNVGDGALTLATILRQYGLAERVLHWVRIAHEQPMTAFRSLGERIDATLFVTICHTNAAAAGTAWTSDLAALEAVGFSVFHEMPRTAASTVDVTFVNVALAQTLLPQPAL